MSEENKTIVVKVENNYEQRKRPNGLNIASYVFLSLTCLINVVFIICWLTGLVASGENGLGVFVFSLFYCVAIIPLLWQIPMTVYYIVRTVNKKDVSVAFKVCTLIFVNLLAGIFMLCDNDK